MTFGMLNTIITSLHVCASCRYMSALRRYMSALRRYMIDTIITFVATCLRFVATCLLQSASSLHVLLCACMTLTQAMTRVFVKLRVAWRDGREEDRVSIWFYNLDEAHRCARNFECWASTRADIRKFAATIKEIQLNFASIY